MPSVVIDVRNQYTPEHEIAMMNAVRSALQDVFNASSDINIRFLVHEPHRFAYPAGCSHPELYTFISIDCFPGRSLDTKRDLYRVVAQNLEKLGIPKDHIKIVVRESHNENWGIAGRAACDSK